MVILHKDILAEYLTIKFGSHETQLSQKYYVIDRLGIYALAKLRRDKKLSLQQQEIIIIYMLFSYSPNE